MKAIAILARSLDSYIGLNIGGKHTLPWRDKTDMALFKAVTDGNFVVMGRKTLESLPSKLNGRKVICLTRNRNYINEKADFVTNYIEEVEKIVGDNLLFVAGGAEIYDLFEDFLYIALISTIYLMKSEFTKFDEQDPTHELVQTGDWDSLMPFYYQIKSWDSGFARLHSKSPLKFDKLILEVLEAVNRSA